MAVIRNPQTGSIGIKVQSGLNAVGQPQYKTLHYSNVKAGASDQDVFAIGVALGGLQTYPVDSISRTETSELVEG